MIQTEENIRLQYVSAGVFRGNKPWIHGRRMIDSYEIIFMLDGEAFIREEETEYSLAKGDILLLHPERLHEGTRLSDPAPTFYWMHFWVSDPDIIRFQHLNIDDTVQADNITFYFSQLLHTVTSPYYPQSSPDALSLLILSYLNVCAQTRIDRSDRLINEITEYIRTGIAEVPTVRSVAAHYGYNPDYLSALFKAKTSMGLKEYIAKTRLNFAKSLLISSGYSIKEVAAQLHFPSEQHFIGFFKYYEGISPMKFKNRSASTHMNIK